MKRIIYISLILILVFFISTAGWYYTKLNPNKNLFPPTSIKVSKTINSKLALYAAEAQQFTLKHHYNSDICFLVDMSLPSGCKRFFVYDLRKKSVITGGLVSHGNCNNYWLLGSKYDNTIGSGCTSLGKYRIGGSYQGYFGKSYKLYGLDSSNSNAFKRNVVLHSYTCVPESEVYPVEICQSHGCPMVSPSYIETLSKYIKSSNRPILLWIYQ